MPVISRFFQSLSGLKGTGGSEKTGYEVPPCSTGLNKGNCYRAVRANWRREVGLRISDRLDEREVDLEGKFLLLTKNPDIRSSCNVTLSSLWSFGGIYRLSAGSGLGTNLCVYLVQIFVTIVHTLHHKNF